jgi:hypothetical protein
MSVNEILTAIGFIGIGGLLKSILDFLIGTRKAKQDAQLTFKEVRYKSIILMSYALVNYEKEKTMLVVNRPDIDSLERLNNELYAEFINMSLYGSDSVVVNLKAFVEIPDSDTLNNLAIAMRKDLYGISTKLKPDTFKLIG